ncbi:VIT domain-containing protein [Pelotomaculum propionicicum]|uniref:VIT domain-containing protein n=1 Tax=Pelotomaculum propionicicum TaxID=258475 RepID=A0A4Y7RLG7_9FIRM|nr:VIT domain-containing protein [Pelotomaculum propionicicum]NLI11527.1 hypothetical protein [Peptococcaceae bacterium]TEB09651.1 hypothetical protein Pmgp_02960 [Pelotomaculum propionicicum]
MLGICAITDKRTGKVFCPLQNVEVRAVIDRALAEVTLTQNYTNASAGNIDAVYTFPLPHGAEVTGFKVKIGGNEINGEFRDKETEHSQSHKRQK